MSMDIKLDQRAEMEKLQFENWDGKSQRSITDTMVGARVVETDTAGTESLKLRLDCLKLSHQ